MLSVNLNWLKPPVFSEDENKTRIARTLHAILLISLFGAGMYAILLVGIAHNEEQSLTFALLATPLVLGVWYLMRKGYVYLASTLLVSLAWLNLTAAAIADGYGIRGISLQGYILIVIVAGLLIGWRASLVFALLNVLSGLSLIYAENLGLLPVRSVIQTGLTIWSAEAVLSLSAAFVLGTALKNLNDASHRAALSESYYRMLFEEAPDGICIADENNRIILANTTLCQMMGYSADEMIGRSATDFVDPKDLASRPPRPIEEIQLPDPIMR